MHRLTFVTGASGSGKTTIIKLLEKDVNSTLQLCYFDSVGVPSSEEMIKQYGSGDNWQKTTIDLWVKKIAEKYLLEKDTILDGQMRLSLIKDACLANDITDYQIILIDCNNEVRKKRLIERGQPELTSEEMMNWSKYLRTEAQEEEKARVFDTSHLTIQETVTNFMKLT
jgi:dephospho-CoA kinase